MARVLRRLHASGWLENVRAWVCISEFLRDKLAIGTGVGADRLFALRHSWDAMKNPPPPDDRGYYLFLGRLVDVKGVEVLLEAWRHLRARLGPATPALHIGGEGLLRNGSRWRQPGIETSSTLAWSLAKPSMRPSAAVGPCSPPPSGGSRWAL
ncbi:hypothetical protein [Verrucomicrobium spinosum]|uniref:hypothetical protein n=1 Tax=Verrucomicrobium spinosum TaxID=2736 RepID=UPI000B1E27BC|nr:hypothetical protein [Verrucomicrobium spinosum]